MKKKVNVLALILSGGFCIQAQALESGIYQQLQDPNCYQVVEMLGEEKGQLAFVEFAGSCSGSLALVCDATVCIGRDEAKQTHLLRAINETSYIYRINKSFAVYRRL